MAQRTIRQLRDLHGEVHQRPSVADLGIWVGQSPPPLGQRITFEQWLAGVPGYWGFLNLTGTLIVLAGGARMELTGGIPTVEVARWLWSVVMPSGAVMELRGAEPAVSIVQPGIELPGAASLALTGAVPTIDVIFLGQIVSMIAGAAMPITGAMPTAQVLNRLWQWQDAFTDTDGTVLSSHTPTSGLGWSRYTLTGGTTNQAIYGNRAYLAGPNANDNSVWIKGDDLYDQDYDVEADIYQASYAATWLAGIVAGIQTGSLAGLRAYYQSNGTNQWRVAPLGSTSFTTGTYNETWNSPGSTKHIKLTIRGTTVKLYIDTVERISVTMAAPFPIGTRAGLYFYNANPGTATPTTQGLHVDNFKAVHA